MPTVTTSSIGVGQAQPEKNNLSDKLLSHEELGIGLMLSELVKLLEKIDTNSPMAKLNETSISDNNGSRIQLWYDPLNVRMLAWTKTKKKS